MRLLWMRVAVLLGIVDVVRAWASLSSSLPRTTYGRASHRMDATVSMLLQEILSSSMDMSFTIAESVSEEELQQFYINAFVGGPLVLLGGNFFRGARGVYAHK